MEHTNEQLLAIPNVEDRIRVLLLEIIYNRLHSDPTPENVAQAVYRVREKVGGNAHEFATRVCVARPTIAGLETGASKGSPSVLRRIADEAERQHLTNTTRWLRKEADSVEFQNTTRGGKR